MSFMMFACGLICLSGQMAAMELSDISYPLTRDEADKKFSKDYSYMMLADGSVRRVWDLADKKVLIDFDTNTNNAILIGVTYKKPVEKKTGIADAHTIAAGNFSKEATWDTPRDKASRTLISDTYGLNNARRKKLKDKAMLFYEMNDKSTRITRISIFSLMPKSNRWELDTITPDSESTAMGSNWGKDFIESIYADEARRKAQNPAAATPSSNNKQGGTADPTLSGRKTAMGTRVSIGSNTRPATGTPTTKPTTPTVTKPTTTPRKTTPTPIPSEQPRTAASVGMPTGKQAASGEQKYLQKERIEGGVQTVSTLPPAPDWLKAVGIDEPAWGHYLGLAVVVLLILIFIIRGIARSSSKIKHQRNFTKIAGNQPIGSAKAPGAPSLKRR